MNFEKPSIKIKKIGSYTKIDEEGRILNPAGVDKIQPEWRAILDDYVEIVKGIFGDKVVAIYVRGSVAKGEAIEGISDVDTMTFLDLTKEELKKVDWKEIKEERKKLNDRYPFQTGVEFVFISIEDINFSDKFILKTSGALIYGKDIMADIPDIKFNRKNIRKIGMNPKRALETAKRKLKNTEDKENIKKIISWLSKRLLRTGAVLVAEKEKLYTRDLYPAYKIFSKHYPEKEKEMKKTLEYALNPIADKDLIENHFEKFITWLSREKNRMLE